MATGAAAGAILRSRGRVRRSLVLGAGQPVLSLTTTGRRTGRSRSTVVAYLREGDTLVVTGANLGNERDPAWVRSIEAIIVVDGNRQPVRGRRATGEEAARLWARWIERLPAADAFRRIAGREIPVIVLEPR